MKRWAAQIDRIGNDENGISDSWLFEILKKVHPLGGALRGDIDSEKAAKLKGLYLEKLGNRLESLDFLQFLPGLTEFGGSFNILVDLAGLCHTPRLEQLYLTGGWGSALDLSPLGNCRELRWLELERRVHPENQNSPASEVRGLEALSALRKIEKLDLTAMGIREIGWVGSMINLNAACLSEKPLQDLAPLKRHP